jgi:hypothetical protein
MELAVTIQIIGDLELGKNKACWVAELDDQGNIYKFIKPYEEFMMGKDNIIKQCNITKGHTYRIKQSSNGKEQYNTLDLK